MYARLSSCLRDPTPSQPSSLLARQTSPFTLCQLERSASNNCPPSPALAFLPALKTASLTQCISAVQRSALFHAPEYFCQPYPEFLSHRFPKSPQAPISVATTWLSNIWFGVWDACVSCSMYLLEMVGVGEAASSCGECKKLTMQGHVSGT